MKRDEQPEKTPDVIYVGRTVWSDKKVERWPMYIKVDAMKENVRGNLLEFEMENVKASGKKDGEDVSITLDGRVKFTVNNPEDIVRALIEMMTGGKV